AMEHLDAFRNADTMLQESEKERFRGALEEITGADGTPQMPKHVSRSAIIQIAKNALVESV
ncbi:MAG: hypothetical protein Q7U44_08745, partial [Desulfuromonadales bacterium]|nr:hypothetical protein [Desulfuromonadales bacterium]